MFLVIPKPTVRPSLDRLIEIACKTLRRITVAASLTCLVLAWGIAGARADDAATLGTEAARILSRHCLQCHDTESQAGGLDLTRRESALLGGDSGPAFVPGDLDASQIWTQIDSGEMPPTGHDRLTPEEQEGIQRWIVADAPWPAPVIDPALFQGDLKPPPTWLRRLTRREYINTVAELTGVSIAELALELLPPDERADGFTNTAYNLNVDLAHIEAYARLAETIAMSLDIDTLLVKLAGRVERTPDGATEVIAEIGRRFLRGPMSELELATFRQVFDAGMEVTGDYEPAMRLVVQAMLQAPRFIFMMEPAAPVDKPLQLADYPLAARLSYAIWGGPPDDELYRAAEAGELSDLARLRGQVDRLLRDPRARIHAQQFVIDWLDLDRLHNLRPNPQRFPAWDAELAADMRDETLAFFDHVAWHQNRPLSDLLSAQITFLTPRLAKHYGIAWDYDAQARAALTSTTGVAEQRGRIQPLAIYDFGEFNGFVPNRSQSGEALHLRPDDPGRLRSEPDALVIQEATALRTQKPVSELTAAIRESNALTVEAWVYPSNRGQTGPARIVSISSGASQRNLTLGQDGDRYVVRCRGTKSDDNGLPEIQAAHGTVELRWTHLVFTVDPMGTATFYVNGQPHATSDIGSLDNWYDGFHLTVGNETSNDRPWMGSLRQIAIYDQALSIEEIENLGTGMVLHPMASVPERGGILTQGSVLSIGGDEASMVTRGLFVLHELLYGRVGNPPPCVDSTPQPSQPGMTQRDLAMTRLNDSSCSGCHAKFEPLAFGLERFNGVGAYAEQDEHGNWLREDGELALPGESSTRSYQNISELMDLLSGSERLQRGITRKVTQFAIARPLVLADEPLLERIHELGWQNGGTYTSIIAEVVTSDLVRTKPPERP